MTRYDTSHAIDYITFSTTKFIPIDDLDHKYEITKPTIANYKQARRYQSGILLQWDDKQPRMKQHVTLSGDTLANLRLYGFDDTDIIVWLKCLNKPKFGRIDVAVTAKRKDDSDIEFTPDYAWQLYQSGKCKTRLQADKPIVDINKNVETFYVGRRDKRKRLLRIYDKGLDIGETANKIIRIELETRDKEPATKIADEVGKGANIAGLIRRYVDFDDDVFDEIMQSKPLPRWRVDNHQKTDHELDNKIKWMLESCAPAIGRLFAELPDGFDSPLLDKFTSRIQYHYNEHKLDKGNT